jgi:hypothetical protein
MIFMKKYSFGLAAIVLAIAFSAFTTKPTALFSFRLKSGVDLTSSSAVENKANWQVTSQLCDAVAEIPCNVTVDESFTHGTGSSRVLNTSGTTISIVSENGYLDTAPNPDVQYKRIASGTNYTFENKTH